MKHLKKKKLLLTAEHASNFVPKEFQELFRGQQTVLESHRGWDPGTSTLAKALVCKFKAPLFQARVSRLLVEVNRSMGHPRLFSEFTRHLSSQQKRRLLEDYYFAHRDPIEKWIAKEVQAGNQILHLSLHSFTPVLDGKVRRADIGLLYDPSREGERNFCKRWQRAIRTRNSNWVVRRNYPYLGISDGLTTSLRNRFSQADYGGVELEINQQLILDPSNSFKKLTKIIVDSLHEVFESFDMTG